MLKLLTVSGALGPVCWLEAVMLVLLLALPCKKSHMTCCELIMCIMSRAGLCVHHVQSWIDLVSATRLMLAGSANSAAGLQK